MKEIWHRADERPQEGVPVCIYNKKQGIFKTGKCYNNPNNREFWSEEYKDSLLFGLIKRRIIVKYNVEKWAYLSDLMPAEGDNIIKV